MCGICAIVGGRERDAGNIEAMVAALRHRGPDAQSHRRLDGADLGHTRLSIIDLESGAQPMADASGRYWIVFNGEIYNYAALRTELIGAGARFQTHSDTEVILAGYIAWGVRCLDRLRGMFAFAIWDTAQRRLFAARDLFGEKPFYYAAAADGALVLASEIRAVLAAGVLAPRLDRRALDAYLCLGYVPPDMSVYENVRPLPPGHYLEWSAAAGTRVVRYWQPVLEARPQPWPEAAERLRELLQQAVRRQMVADVPLGAFLSGGHDSSTVVALMQRQSDRPVKTFSVGFGEMINELPYAQAVADLYGTEHHAIDVGAPPVADLLQRMAEVYDEPFMDPSHIPTYLIAQYARRHVKVVLSGDGADELFGGYAWYPLFAASLEVSTSALLWLLARSASRLLRDRVGVLARYSRAQGIARRAADPWERYVRYKFGFSEDERARLWHGAVTPFFPAGDYRPGDAVFGMDRVFYFDLTAYLPGDILVKVDRAAMAHGLETRAPFLDRDLIEFALSLPANLKVTSGRTKVLFKSALKRFWPAVLHERGKQGFAAPYGAWLARADVQAQVARVFGPGSALRELLPGVSNEIARARDIRTWNLLTLGLWLERHAPS